MCLGHIHPSIPTPAALRYSHILPSYPDSSHSHLFLCNHGFQLVLPSGMFTYLIDLVSFPPVQITTAAISSTLFPFALLVGYFCLLSRECWWDNVKVPARAEHPRVTCSQHSDQFCVSAFISAEKSFSYPGWQLPVGRMFVFRSQLDIVCLAEWKQYDPCKVRSTRHGFLLWSRPQI